MHNGIPGRHFALQYGHAEAIRADNEILFEARKKGWINNATLMELLVAKNNNGVAGFLIAQQNGHVDACKEQGKAILHAYAKGYLTETEFTGLDAPTPAWLQ